MEVSEPLIEKICTKIAKPDAALTSLKGTFEYNICEAAVATITCAAVFITSNVIVSKCLKLPFSRLASAGISIVGGALGAAAFALAERNDSSFTQSIKSYLNEFAK